MNALQRKRVAKLVAALRSGKYKQTTYSLRDPDGFCCLGVACDMYRKEARRGKWNGGLIFSIGDDEREADLPRGVMRWYGFTNPNPGLGRGVSSMRANDSFGWNFKRIADAFERTYLKPATRRKA